YPDNFFDIAILVKNRFSFALNVFFPAVVRADNKFPIKVLLLFTSFRNRLTKDVYLIGNYMFVEKFVVDVTNFAPLIFKQCIHSVSPLKFISRRGPTPCPK